MPVSYRMARRASKTDARERRGLHDELGVLLCHLDAFGVRLVSIAVDLETDVAAIQLDGKIPRDQMEHVGIEPASEKELEALAAAEVKAR